MGGTAFLRVFDHRAAVVGKHVEALLAAPEVGTLTKYAIGEAAMKRENWFHPEEYDTFAEMLEAHHARGLTEGMRATLTRQL